MTAFAALALLVAACGGDAGDAGGGDAGASAAGTTSIEIEAGDLYYDPEELTAAAGTIEMTLINVGVAEHDIVIEEADDTEVVFAAGGETATGSIELEAGTYTFYCSIPGHRSAMEGTLIVD